MKTGTWTDGKRTESGRWDYCWGGDYFVVILDSRDPVTGMPRQFRVYDDHPEWGNFKLVREAIAITSDAG